MEERIAQLVSRVQALTRGEVAGPTLIYFDVVGIAWPIRCLLHVHKIDYDYVPVTIMDWMFRASDGTRVLKNAFRNHHLPLYVDSEVYLDQSMQIIATLADRVGMMGETATDRASVQAILAHCYDALFHPDGLLTVNVRLNIPDEVAQARLDSFMGGKPWGLVSNGYRNQLSPFVNYLETNRSGSGFMVGECMTAADLSAFNVLCNWFKAFDRELFSTEFPQLDAYIQHIAQQPGIADYIRTVQEATLWFPLPDVAMRLTSPEDLQGLVPLPG